jgi:hypothetical protein
MEFKDQTLNRTRPGRFFLLLPAFELPNLMALIDYTFWARRSARKQATAHQ